jgi:hypothetical protein
VPVELVGVELVSVGGVLDVDGGGGAVVVTVVGGTLVAGPCETWMTTGEPYGCGLPPKGSWFVTVLTGASDTTDDGITRKPFDSSSEVASSAVFPTTLGTLM